ncbi:PHA/PHB synthase family protein [Methylobacterium nodulans]|uniref:Poly(R)-hydroxyalkanoic acid synthase, class I n=1 Tax=Methylobacterium nodulans (strain LMG 21967 / CNCM I-2342 / ORS 2060) TaxID=460265 RepID=B8IFS7_METNO|nr:class I poly(R)-hydroxyalkanoic acid synthase [Methylobacterium nodulans]ACL59637.1 poly(R)-hydroxyalkanoic acid synthase, class I [Methylobacterium nodulans ORS 2060]
MADQTTGAGTTPSPTTEASGSDRASPSPDMMLSLWTGWMEQISAAPQGLQNPVWPPAVPPFGAVPPLLSEDQLARRLTEDPLLRSIDQIWNANPLREVVPIDWAGIAWALRTVWLRSVNKPEAAASLMDLGQGVWKSLLTAWEEAGQNWLGLFGLSSASAPAAARPDKRFSAPEWRTNPAYLALKELYLLASDWLLERGNISDLDEAEQHRLNFHLRQFVDAMSPALVLTSNPVALRKALETGGASLADGARNLLADIAAGRLSMVDANAFAPGRNLALTPGKVVHRNALIELIQYSPTTEQVHQTPLLIVPPWINKFYILDMQPKNSMVRYLVSQGFTVFLISWRNPDASMDGIGIEDYIDLGPLEASEVIREITGSETVNAMGYCIGGVLLTLTLAILAAKGDQRFNSTSFMVSPQDFSRIGDTAVFMDEPTLDLIEQQMMERGYLDSRAMSNMFNLLRSNDLIWSNVVNNYLLGNKPPAFDLLYWNSDGTRMTRAAHSWYLRNTYVENNLIKPGKISLKGETVDLGRVRQDTYAVGCEKDHIVPWDSAWRITQLFGGAVRYVLASSGHVAGVINPPGGKGEYRTAEGDKPAATPEQWLKGAKRHSGSWWPDWSAWLSARSGPLGAPPALGSAQHPPLQDAPGTYVLQT